MLKNVNAASLLEQFSLEELHDNNDIIIVDVRSPEEYAHQHIHGAINVPIEQLAQLDPTEYADKTAIFHCRSGRRTAMNEHILAATPFKQRYCLSGGLNQWVAADLPVKAQHAAPIDVMRQVQLIVSLMILIGLLLSELVSPYFLILPLIAGLGLLVAGLTGFCGMAVMLKHLPWNKSKQEV